MNSPSEYSAPHSDAPAQQFSVLLFAGLRDAMRCERLSISVPHPDAASTLTVADLLQACAAQYPTLSKWLPHVRVAVNLEYSHPHTPLQNGDEIAFIPPVAGGCCHQNFKKISFFKIKCLDLALKGKEYVHVLINSCRNS